MTVEVEVDTRGMETRLSVAPDVLLRGARRALPRVGEVGRSIMVDYLRSVYRGYQRGGLASSIRFEVTDEGVRVGPTVPYAEFVDQGTTPHEIRPRNPGGALRFAVAGGRVVFAKRVQHPGTKGHHFLQATGERWPEPAARIIEAAAREAAEGV